jgi:DNA polymerase III epsilon subunit family exonuclease
MISATPLADLPVLVFDCETTGLDVKKDVIVSVGGVEMQGVQIDQDAVFDQLINPGRPIPLASRKIHGISDDMVRDAPPFLDVWRKHIEPAIAGRVIVGHNIGFDIAHLRKATSGVGIRWAVPPTLDTLLLSAALEPEREPASLDELASEFGVRIEGRHTALGDALAAAAVYQALVIRLKARGVETLGQAEILSKKPKAIRRMQKRAGW